MSPSPAAALRAAHAAFLASAADAQASRDAARLSALTDQFVALDAPDGEAVFVYERAALALAPLADCATRAHVAARLARFPATPAPVLDELLCADRTTAAILLQHCDRLDPSALMDIARDGDADCAATLAARADLDAALIEALLKRSEPAIALALANNASVALLGDALERLKANGRGDASIGKALAARIEDPQALAHLFLTATDEQRGAIVAHANAQFSGDRPPPRDESDPLVVDVEPRARGGHWGMAGEIIGHALDCPSQAVGDLLREESGDGLCVVFAAMRMPREVAARILLARDGQSPDSFERMNALLEQMGDLDPRAALWIMRQVGADEANAA